MIRPPPGPHIPPSGPVSRDAAPYEVSVLCNCVTTVDGHIQQFALHVLCTRVAVVVDA